MACRNAETPKSMPAYCTPLVFACVKCTLTWAVTIPLFLRALLSWHHRALVGPLFLLELVPRYTALPLPFVFFRRLPCNSFRLLLQSCMNVQRFHLCIRENCSALSFANSGTTLRSWCVFPPLEIFLVQKLSLVFFFFLSKKIVRVDLVTNCAADWCMRLNLRFSMSVINLVL